jgi:hypothetical protein
VAPTATDTPPLASETPADSPTAAEEVTATPELAATPAAATPTPGAASTPPVLVGEVRIGEGEQLADGKLSVPVYVTSDEPLRRFGLSFAYDQTTLRPRQIRLSSWARARHAVANGYVDGPGVLEVRFASRRGLLSHRRNRPLLRLVFEVQAGAAATAGAVRLMAP